MAWSTAGGEQLSEALQGFGVDPLAVSPFAFIILLILGISLDPAGVYAVFSVLIVTSPITMPIGFIFWFWITWVHYIRLNFWAQQEHVLLEIQLPPEVEKSPLAMESFMTTLWNTGGETTFINRIWKGQFRPIWSLELVSNEGRIGYYIHLRESWKPILEARLYGQFPEAKVIQVEDYATKVHFNLEEYDLWGSEFKKGSIQALPLKTYVDYKLDKNDDQELRVDPLTNVLEFLSQMGPGEHLWVQIVCKGRAGKGEDWYGFFVGDKIYNTPAKAEIQKIFAEAAKRNKEAQAASADQDENTRTPTTLTQGERDKIEAIEHSMQKLVLECGVRVVYFAKREVYRGVNVGAIVRFFDSFRSQSFHNTLGVTRGLADMNYPWQDWNSIRHNKEKRLMYHHYVERSYFYAPYNQDPVCLTTEELATLWHFPGSVVQTPGLSRVPSRRAEAPPNLPTLPI